MLRRSTTALVFIPAPGPAKWCGVPNNDNIEHLITLVKLSKKNRLHHGAYFHRIPDREYYYSQFGGPRGGRFTIRRSCSKKQYLHHTESQGKYDIHHTNPTQAWSGNGGPGGLFRNIWDSQCSGSNPFWDACFKVNGRNLEKDNAVQWMESWGVKYKVLDWRTQPKQYDMVYTKHRLYAHNFPWKKDPYTNAWKGDADWQWRGAEKIDYNVHGAGTASLANEFRSLWNLPEPFTKPRFPAAAAPKAAATPKPKVEAPKPKAEAPKAAAPKPAETPKAEAPKPEAPKAASPTPKPAAEAPKEAEAPKPAAETPKKAPETVAPAAAAAAATPAAAEAPKPKTE